MKKNLLIASLLCGATVLSTSCNDGDVNLEYEGYSTVCYIEQYGLQEVEYFNIGNDVVFTTIIGKGGTDPDMASKVTLSVMTDEELNRYNVTNNKELVTLPAEWYSFTSEYELTAGESKKEVQIVFKSGLAESGLDFDAIDYVLPLKITNSSGSLDDEKNQLILRPVITTPKITPETPGLQNTISIYEGFGEDYTKDMNVRMGLNVLNDNWAFKVEIETDRKVMQEYVDRFNASDESEGKQYILMPEGSYTMTSTLDYPTWITWRDVEVEIKATNLYAGTDYILPVIPKSCTGMNFKIDSESVAYIPVTVSNQIDLAGRLTSNAEEYGGDAKMDRLMDGVKNNIGDQYLWQSMYAYPSEQKPNIKFDPNYGVYVDIDIAGITAQTMNLNVFASAGNNYPKEMKVYMGADENSLSKVAGTTNAYPSFQGNGENKWSTGEIILSPESDYKIIRLALLKNKNGNDMCGDLGWWLPDGYTSWYCNNIGMIELELFGYK